MNESSPVARLTAALEAWLVHKAHPSCTNEQFLAEHEELRDLLEPMLHDDAGPPSAATPALRQIGDFRVVRELGRGGMGIVYEAVQVSLGRRVALKVLARPLLLQPNVVARFRRESELLARLNHPHVVPVYAAGFVDGVPFHAMELVPGCTVADVLHELAGARPAQCDGATLASAVGRAVGDPAAGARLAGKSHVDACLRLVLPVAQALVAAHAHGILHRDVKPANVLLRTDGTPLLSDFGLARDANDPSLTRTGDLAGTPYYVSPEQAAGDPAGVDHRTDVFSLAVVLYELLLLERPFDGDTTDVVLERVRGAEPPALARRGHGLPHDLACVLDKALQKNRAERYATMAEFAGELSAVLELRPVRARRRGPLTRTLRSMRRQPLRAALVALLVLGLPLVLGLSLYIWWQQPRIAAAEATERLPRVERLLEIAMLHQDFDDDQDGRQWATEAHSLLPELPEVLAAMVLVEHRAGDRAARSEHFARLREIAPDTALQMQEGTDAAEPATALGWFVRGMLHLDAGHGTGDIEDYRKAAHALQRAVARAGSPRALFHCQYLHALMHLRDAAAIRAAAADVRHLWPESPFAAYWRGFALRDVDPTASAADLRRAIELAPDLPQPYVRLARLLEDSDAQQAYDLYRRALDVAPAIQLPVGIIRTLHSLGRADEALALADDAVARSPRSWHAHSARGSLLGKLGRVDDAMAEFEAAMLHGPRAAQPRVARAMLQVELGRHQDALADASTACTLDPDNTACHSVHGTTLLHVDRPRDAIVCFERVTTDWPERVHGWKSLAMARRRSGELVGAQAAIEQAMRLGTSDADVWREQGKIQNAAEQWDGAAASFVRAIELDAKDAEAHINLAGLRLRAGDADGALLLLATARSNRPRLQAAWTSSFAVLEQLGRHDEARALRAEFAQRQRQRDAK